MLSAKSVEGSTKEKISPASIADVASPLKNFLKFSFGTWINALIALITVPIITWFISPDELGKATVFTLAFNLLLNLILLGVDQSFVRFFNETPPADRPKLLFNSIAAPAIASLVVVLLMEIFRTDLSFLFFSSYDHAFVVDILSLTLFGGCFNRFALLILRMQNKAVRYSLVQIILSVSNLLFTIFFAFFFFQSFIAVILSFAISQFASLFTGIFLEREVWKKIKGAKNYFDKVTISRLLAYGIPFIPTLAFDWIFQSTDRTFLRIFSTFSEIGIYATASRMAAALNILQVGFSTFWVPFVFERFTRDQTDKSFYEATFDTVSVAFLGCIYLILIFKDLILLILPSSYGESVSIFPLLLFVPMFYSLSDITSVGINIHKKTIYHFYVLVICCGVSVLCGFVLIPSMGAKGAVIGTFCSYFTFFIFRSIMGTSLYPLPLKWLQFTMALIPAIIVAAIAFYDPNFQAYLIAVPCLIFIMFTYRKALKELFLRFKSLL